MSNNTDTTLNKSQLAEYMGVSTQAIDHWIRYDPPVPFEKEGRQYAFDINEVLDWYYTTLRPDLNPEHEEQGFDRQLAEARKAHYQAEIEELKAARMRGELINKDKAMEVFVGAVEAAKAQLLSIPNELSQDLAAEDDTRKIKYMLEQTLKEKLAELSDQDYKELLKND